MGQLIALRSEFGDYYPILPHGFQFLLEATNLHPTAGRRYGVNTPWQHGDWSFRLATDTNTVIRRNGHEKTNDTNARRHNDHSGGRGGDGGLR